MWWKPKLKIYIYIKKERERERRKLRNEWNKMVEDGGQRGLDVWRREGERKNKDELSLGHASTV